MNNKKFLKEVMNDFDKDVNYKKIMQKIKIKKEVSYLKMALLPVCSIVFILSLILLSPKTKNLDDNKNNVNNGISQFDIYGTVEDELSWAYNVTDTKLTAERSNYIVKVKVLDIGNGTYEYSSKNCNPTTPIKVETLSVLKGDKNVEINQILTRGGTVTIEEYIKNRPVSSIKKMGLDKLSDEEKKSKYMKIVEPGNYDLQIGKTYVVALKEDENGNLFIGANGYSIFEEDESISALNNKQPVYKNVLTGNELVIDKDIKK